MKTSFLIIIVVVLHCAAIGALFFIQGCGTTSVKDTSTAVMPPPAAPTPAPEKPVDISTVKEEKSPAPKIYVVQPGDSVSRIAKRYHIKPAEIVTLNKLSEPNKIRIGQKLFLPGYADVTSRPEKKKAVPDESAPFPGLQEQDQEYVKEYVVQPGDTLLKIAARFGTTVSAIQEANKLLSDKILIGQKLVIPEPGKSVPAGQQSGVEVEETAAILVETDQESFGAEKNESASVIIHVVQPKEYLSSIAKMYAVTVNELAEFNQLSPNDTVRVGQRLKIP